MPLIFRLLEQRHANRGTGPFTPELAPTQGQSLLISGFTKDSTGAILGNVALDLFDTDTDTKQGTAMSDTTTGFYSFSAGMGRTYYVVAYKAGAPDVAGTTVNTLVVG